jgi:hypothetical protein
MGPTAFDKTAMAKSEACAPLFAGSKYNLPPVSFLQLIMVAMAYPSVRNPTLVFMGWTLPAAGSPDVTAIFPAMITVDPHISTLRRPTALFNDRGRGANADHNLCK